MRRLLVASAWASLVACQAGDLDLGQSRRPVFGGDAFTDDYDAVCALYIVRPDDDDGNPQDPIYCTGTHIAPAIVLTAASCVADNLAAGTLSDITVRFGPSYESSTDEYGVDEIVLHRYYDLRSSGQYDLAMLHLDATPSAPVVAHSERVLTGADVPEEDLCGEPLAFDEQAAGCVTLIGFGETTNDSEDFGARKRVVTPLETVSPMTLFAGTSERQTCAGDSGGPAFLYLDDAMGLVAVTSLQSTCFANIQRTLIQPHLADFIYPYIDRYGATCGLDDVCETECPRTADPDCDPCAWDDTCVEDCPSRDWDCDIGSFAGEPCAIDGECEQHGSCIPAADDASFTYCTLACDPAASDCPASMVCDATEEQCEWPTPSPGSQGFPCNLSSECRSEICEETICVNVCDSPDDCADPYVCGPSSVQPGTDVCLGERVSGGGGFCTPSSIAPRAPRTTGWGALALLALAAGGVTRLRRRRA